MAAFFWFSVATLGVALSSSSSPTDESDSSTQVLVLPPDDSLDAPHSGSDAAARLRSKSKDPMQQLLNWGLENSDPAKLKDVMKHYKENNLTIKDVYGADFLDSMFVDEAGGMRQAIEQIADFRNASFTDEELEMSLTRLQGFVEQVDNAGNMHQMGGLEALLELALSGDGEARGAELRALALWTVGVAVQNNAPVQDDIFRIGGLELLVAQLSRCGVAPGRQGDNGTADGRELAVEGPLYCGKLVYTVSGLVRNNATIQESADALGLFDWLMDVGASYPNAGVGKKALGLLDTALGQSPGLRCLDSLVSGDARRQEAVAAALLGAVGGDDEDLAEKGLRVVNRLLSLRPMLFKAEFKGKLETAAQNVIGICEKKRAKGDEVCEGISGIWKHSDLMLAARDHDDAEL